MLPIIFQRLSQALAQIDTRPPTQRVRDEPVIAVIAADVYRFPVRRELDLVDLALSIDLDEQFGESA